MASSPPYFYRSLDLTTPHSSVPSASPTLRSGEPLIAATQDFLTAAFLLTRRDTLLSRHEFCQAAATLSDATEQVSPRAAVGWCA